MRLVAVFAALTLAACSAPSPVPDASVPDIHDAGTDMTKKSLLTALVGLAAVGSATAILSPTVFEATNRPPAIAEPLASVSGFANHDLEISCPCIDDGKPEPATLSILWTNPSGPGICTFENVLAEDTQVSCDIAGTYGISCACCDEGPAETCTWGHGDTASLVATVAYEGAMDRIVTAGGTVANFCASVALRMHSAYTGGPYLLQRVSDDATQEAVFNALGAVDEEAVAAFCGASDCNARVLHDQCGAPCDLSQTTELRQPKVYDGATGQLVKEGALPWATWTYTTSPGPGWTASTSCGISGVTAVTHAYAAVHATTGSTHMAMYVGSTADQAFFAAGARFGAQMGRVSGAGERLFTPSLALTEPTFMVSSIGAGAQVGQSTARQNGADLPQANTTGATLTTTIASTGFAIGIRPDGIQGMSGGGAWWASWGTTVTGPPLTQLDAEGAALINLTSPLSSATVIVSGQSNAAFLVLPPSWGWVKVAKGATQCDRFLPGHSSGIWDDQLGPAISAADPDEPLLIWWIQGENDAGSLETANAYGECTAALVTAIRAIRPDAYWLDTLLHEAMYGREGYPYGEIVNTEKLAFLATISNDGYLNPTVATNAASFAGLHWLEPLQTEMMLDARDYVNSIYPP